MRLRTTVLIIAAFCAAGCDQRRSAETASPDAPEQVTTPAAQPAAGASAEGAATVEPGLSPNMPSPPPGQVMMRVMPVWRKFAGDPGPRYAIDMVWDTTARRVVLFGGAYNARVEGAERPDISYYNDLWAWYPDDASWKKIETKGETPAARAYYAAAYDPRRNGLWIHGGSHTHTLGDLWFFDCASSTWREVEIVASERPEMRAGHSLHYNPKTDELLMFGGFHSWETMRLSHEFWAFDCQNAKWSRKPLGPRARFMHLAALAPDEQKLYITGGFGVNAQYTEEELWVYDIAQDSWTSRDDTTGSKILAGRMEYVPAQKFLVTICGNDGRAERRYDLETHEWKNTTVRPSLPVRGFHGTALDPVGERLFVYGGTFGGFFGTCLEASLWMRDFKRDKPTAVPAGPAKGAPVAPQP